MEMLRKGLKSMTCLRCHIIVIIASSERDGAENTEKLAIMFSRW